MDEKEYKSAFSLNAESSGHDRELLLQYALDIRKFEIELYWKRATYFWVLIASAFTAHFVILGADKDKLIDKQFLAYIVACLGFVFTFAWCQANRGSKYWQENWENHVDMIEDYVIGPLYKTILSRPKNKATLAEYLIGPAPISVSKVNQWVNVFTLLVWLALIYRSIGPLDASAPIDFNYAGVALIVGVFIVALSRFARSHLSEHRHVANKRETSIITE